MRPMVVRDCAFSGEIYQQCRKAACLMSWSYADIPEISVDDMTQLAWFTVGRYRNCKFDSLIFCSKRAIWNYVSALRRRRKLEGDAFSEMMREDVGGNPPADFEGVLLALEWLREPIKSDVVFYFLRQKTIAEIAHKRGVSKQAVSENVHRGIGELRKILGLERTQNAG